MQRLSENKYWPLNGNRFSIYRIRPIFGAFAGIMLSSIVIAFIQKFFNLSGYLPEIILIIMIFSGLIIPHILISMSQLEKLKHTELQLRNSTGKYQTVIDNISEIIYQTDAGGRWNILNPAWEKVTGYTIEESLGKKFIDYISPENRRNASKIFEQLLSGKEGNRVYETECITKNGQIFWVEIIARTIFDSNGKVTGVSGILRDITEKKQMEKELRSKDKLLQGISEATGILLSTTDYDTAFNDALEELGSVTGAHRVSIFENYLNSEDGEMCALRKYEWCKEGVEPWMDKLEMENVSYTGHGLARWYNELKDGNEICGITEDFPECEGKILKERNIESTFIAPILLDGTLWGFITFDDCIEKRVWSKVEKTALFAAAASIAGAIKRIKGEEALKQAMKNDFNETVKNLQTLVFKLRKREDGEFYYTFFEGKFAERIGFSTEKVAGKRLEEFLPKERKEYLLPIYKKAFEGEASSYEFELDNRVTYGTLSPIIKDGSVTEVIGSVVDITERKDAERKIEYMAFYDALTGLPNRTLFSQRLNNAIKNAEKGNSIISVMFFDLDNFKKINDTLGHAIGDLLLKEVAVRLTHIFDDYATISRMGGDEFTILLQDIKNEEIAKGAQRILDVFKNTFMIDGNEIYITPSIGISLYPYHGSNIETLIKNADMAMYKAKEFGKNNYQFYTSAMNDRAVERLRMENDLRRAVENDELFLAYQPKLDLSTGEITGCEALLRWKHPELGIIPPGNFIPLAEETGLIIPIGKWVLHTACRQNKAWQDSGHRKIRISVNMSVKQFYQENLIEMICNILEETGLEPEYLEFEITENIIMHNTGKILKIIQMIKSLGISISIDDFGTGFSSLSYLKQFSADIIKIDRSFVKDIGASPNDAAITTAIINMAHSLNLKVIAEGVETQEQLNFLKSKKCNEIQGYLCGKPMASEEFTNVISNCKNMI